jgi:hypothetical protein
MWSYMICVKMHGNCDADTALYQTHYIENETRFWLGITEHFYVLKTVYRWNASDDAHVKSWKNWERR